MRFPALPAATALALLAVLPPARALAAQEPVSTGLPARPGAPRDSIPDPRRLPPAVSDEVMRAFTTPGALRVNGALAVDADRTVDGDVAVMGGPLTISGRVNGRVVAVDADVVLHPGARVDGGILVVGGQLIGRDEATVGGEVRVLPSPVATGDTTLPDDWGWRARRPPRRWVVSDLKLASAHAYNRVEGLPIYFGPTVQEGGGDVRATFQALGVFRTSDELRWSHENLGHDVRGEASVGRARQLFAGGRLFDVVEAVEPWQLSETEAGLAAVFFQRDYRDYFARHGGTAYVGARAGSQVDLTVALGDQRWGAREAHDPFALFRLSDDWRPNPMMDVGRFHLLNTTLRVDTRNDALDPWSGWYFVGDWERGTGTVDELAPRSSTCAGQGPEPCGIPGGAVSGAIAPGVPHTYDRAFLDLRRYNRVSPNASLNLRVVLGGQLGTGELPLERRLSLGGPGTLPGFEFRHVIGPEDRDQCGTATTAPPGRPAECERIALFQAEYRGDLHLGGVVGSLIHPDRTGHGRFWSPNASWVLFADAGRGWLVGDARGGTMYYRPTDFPSLATFNTDVGLGLDADVGRLIALGVYVAKAVSDVKEPAHVSVRLRRRF